MMLAQGTSLPETVSVVGLAALLISAVLVPIIRWLTGRLTTSLDGNTEAVSRFVAIVGTLTTEIATSITASTARHDAILERLASAEEERKALIAALAHLVKRDEA